MLVAGETKAVLSDGGLISEILFKGQTRQLLAKKVRNSLSLEDLKLLFSCQQKERFFITS